MIPLNTDWVRWSQPLLVLEKTQIMNHLGRPYMIDSVAVHHLCDSNDP